MQPQITRQHHTHSFEKSQNSQRASIALTALPTQKIPDRRLSNSITAPFAIDFDSGMAKTSSDILVVDD